MGCFGNGVMGSHAIGSAPSRTALRGRGNNFSSNGGHMQSRDRLQKLGNDWSLTSSSMFGHAESWSISRGRAAAVMATILASAEVSITLRSGAIRVQHGHRR